MITFSRTWAMPDSSTFSIKPIGEFVKKYLKDSIISCDPFCGSNPWTTYNNDINPRFSNKQHEDAEDFMYRLVREGVKCDLILLDPPYSPRQISECYKEIGLKVGMKETQNAKLYSRIKRAANRLISDNGIVLSFGWNSSGMGLKHSFSIIEILLCCHGAAHNDTICLAERKLGA